MVVGDIVTDVLATFGAVDGTAGLSVGSDTPAAIRFTGGGQAANTAAWLASTGGDVIFVGVVGDDRAGEERLAELRDVGVQTRVRARNGAATGCVIVLAQGDERTMINDRGANALLNADDVAAAIRDVGLGGGLRHLHLSGYTLLDDRSRHAALRALEVAREAGLTTSVDAASAAPLRQAGAEFLEWVRGVDILFANMAEAEALGESIVTCDPAADAGGLASELATRIGGAVLVKLAAAGALWADGDQVVRHDAVPVPVIDATGAGDAFAAGFLGSWIHANGAGSPNGHRPPGARSANAAADALAAGCALGAQVVGRIGAR